MKNYFLFAAILLLFPLLSGWAGCSKSVVDPKKLDYKSGAKALYQLGQRHLKAGNYEEARKIFQKIKTDFPFSHYATLAELAIGDTYFKAGKYLEAINVYKLFVKLHPSHPKAGYAAFYAAYSYDKLRPWNFFLFPPAHEKDATTTVQAIQAYREFLQDFPNHPLRKRAEERLKDCLKQMARHELYVANYYWKRGKYRAVVWRTEYLLKKYPKVGLDAEALLLQARALIRLKEYARARNALNRLIKDYPSSPQASSAKALLTELSSKSTPVDEKAPPSTRPSPLKKEPPGGKGSKGKEM